MSFSAKELIQKKRDGLFLSEPEIKTLLGAYVKGEVPDYQMAAWLMAVCLRGCSEDEILYLTRTMLDSGRRLPPRSNARYRIDKHSTGGVGDKTSLILVPLVTAVCERLWGRKSVQIPMMSGRALGHSGGTLDKLETVPGFRTQYNLEEAGQLLSDYGYFMMGQTDDLAPADRLVYALRDATATVESRALIVASILSKKISEGLDGLVLDVKFGSGAFTPSESAARELAETLVRVASAFGVKTSAMLTWMGEPLGYAVGNELEIEECAEFFETDSREKGLLDVTMALASQMVVLAGRNEMDLTEAVSLCRAELEEPRARELFYEMFAAQGGDWSKFLKNRQSAEKTLRVHRLFAPESGYLCQIHPRELGNLVNELGGGRECKTDRIDPSVGVRLRCKVGSRVKADEEVLSVYYRDESQLTQIKYRLDRAVEWSKSELPPVDWVLGRIE